MRKLNLRRKTFNLRHNDAAWKRLPLAAAAPSSGSRGRPPTRAAVRRRRQSRMSDVPPGGVNVSPEARSGGGTPASRVPKFSPFSDGGRAASLLKRAHFFSLLRDPPGSQMKWEGRRRVDRRGVGNAVFIWQSGDGIKGLVVECCYYSL